MLLLPSFLRLGGQVGGGLSSGRHCLAVTIGLDTAVDANIKTILATVWLLLHLCYDGLWIHDEDQDIVTGSHSPELQSSGHNHLQCILSLNN